MSFDDIEEILESTEFHESLCEDLDEVQCAVIVLRQALGCCLESLKKDSVYIVDRPEEVKVGL